MLEPLPCENRPRLGVFCMTIDQLNAEIDLGKMALDLFPEDTISDDYKELVIVLTYRTIKENPNIQLKTLHWTLRAYNIQRAHVDCALSGLLKVFKSIQCWGNAESRNHKVIPSEKFDAWVADVVASNPNLLAYDVKKKGR